MARSAWSRLISSRMLAGLSAFFPASVTMQAASSTRDAFGQPMVAWTDVDDLADLGGQLSAAGEEKVKRLGLVVERTSHVLALQGCFRGIEPTMRAVVDGAPYEVTGVRHDSQLVITYLGLLRVVASSQDAG